MVPECLSRTMGDKPWTHPIAPLDVPVCILMRSVLSQRNRATGEQVSRFPRLPLGRREFRAPGRSHVPLAEELEELRRRENIEKAAQEPEPQWVSPVSSWGHLAIFLVLGRVPFSFWLQGKSRRNGNPLVQPHP